jgi:tRNA pseudouridine55 synthase
MGVNGILNVSKPCGPTSFDIVASIRRICGEKRVGHAGTLDPAASGVLPVCLGQATRVAEYIHHFSKEYVAVITLGATTDTLDAGGSVTSRSDPVGITAAQVSKSLHSFLGEISQVPPAYSAIKIKGKQSYKLARAGVSVPLEPRRVTIHSIDILEFTLPSLRVRIQCSTGTYIRSIAADLGTALGCGAYLQALVRTAYGPYKIEEGLSPEDIGKAAASGGLSRLLHPVDHPLQSWQKQVLDDEKSAAVLGGISLTVEDAGLDTGQLLACYDRNGRFLAIYKFVAGSGVWRPEKVFNSLNRSRFSFSP